MHANLSHPLVSRRTALQAGAVGLLGLGMGDLAALRAAIAPGEAWGRGMRCNDYDSETFRRNPAGPNPARQSWPAAGSESRVGWGDPHHEA